MTKGFTKEKRHDKIEVRIEPTLKELFADLAFEQEITVSDYIRSLIRAELKKKKKL